MKTLSLITILLLTMGSAQGAIPPSSPFQVSWDDTPISLTAGGPFELRLTIHVPEGYYIYADETDVDFMSLEGIIITSIALPKSTPYKDPYLGKEVAIYKKDVQITITGHAPEHAGSGIHDLTARVSFRGCSPTLCFRPEEHEVSFRLEVAQIPLGERHATEKPPVVEKGRDKEKVSASEGAGFKNLLKVRDFSLILEQGFGVTILIVFIAGLLTSLTPCVWPVIPVVLLFIGVHPHKRFLENLLLSASLFLGLIIVYAGLGIIAVAAGKNLGFLFQQRIFLAIVVLFFLAMSLSMFGAFDLKLPRSLQHKLHSLGGKGYRGAILAGMGTGLVASPCSGPVLAALLGYVALQGNYPLGFVLLVIYGIGFSLFVVILGACYGELAGKLRGGPWMVWMKRALGLVLLFPAAFYMGSLFRWSGDRILSDDNRPRIEWVTDEAHALKFAEESDRPIMIEFGADWCPPCRALDAGLFRRPDIVALSMRLVPFRVDATIETREVRRLIDKYRVQGWPTIIFLDPEGRPYQDLRVSDYNSEAIEHGIKEAIERAKK